MFKDRLYTENQGNGSYLKIGCTQTTKKYNIFKDRVYPENQGNRSYLKTGCTKTAREIDHI